MPADRVVPAWLCRLPLEVIGKLLHRVDARVVDNSLRDFHERAVGNIAFTRHPCKQPFVFIELALDEHEKGFVSWVHEVVPLLCVPRFLSVYGYLSSRI